jgi:uncharacterized protein (DUF1697 family)
MSNSTKTWIGLFRGVNVGGNNKLPMKDLVKHMEAYGFKRVKTYIASGNVIFDYDTGDTQLDETDIAREIEMLVLRHFGFRPKIFLVTSDHLQKLLNANPFKDREHKGKAQHLFFIQGPIAKADAARMDELKADNEAWHLSDECFYFYAPDGVGRSKLIEKLSQCLKADMTARNLNTVETLLEMGRA